MQIELPSAEYQELIALARAVGTSLVEIRAVTAEMRARKVNHGKHPSPTLVAWADRIDASLVRIQQVAQEPDEDADQAPDDDPPPRHRGWGTLSREERDEISGMED